MSHRERVRWHLSGPDLEVDLAVTDYFPAMDLWPRGSGSLSSEIARGHTESAGAVTGMARVRGRTSAVQGLCYRDHSWGRRDWSKLGEHVWLCGTIGVALNFSAIDFRSTLNERIRESLVVRDRRFTPCRSFELEHRSDGRTSLLDKGHIRFLLAGGTSVRGEFEPVDGVGALLHGYLLFDHICRLRVGQESGLFVLELGRRHDDKPLPENIALAATNGWSMRWGAGYA